MDFRWRAPCGKQSQPLENRGRASQAKEIARKDTETESSCLSQEREEGGQWGQHVLSDELEGDEDG